MGARLHFLGSGSARSRGALSEGGFLVVGDRSSILVDPGPGAAAALAQLKLKEVDAVVVTHESRGHDANLVKVKKKPSDEFEIARDEKVVRIRLPDCQISYVFGAQRKVDDVDVLVILDDHIKVLEHSKPKLAILTGFEKIDPSPVYRAREVQQYYGVQTIAAQDGLLVDVQAYDALSSQKSLRGFTR